jgi:hypothetical protein
MQSTDEYENKAKDEVFKDQSFGSKEHLLIENIK